MNWLFRKPSIFEPSPFGRIVSYLLLGFWALVVLLPLYWLVATSVKTALDVSSGPLYIPYLQFEPSNHAWWQILVEEGRSTTLAPYTNTIIIGVTSAVLSLALGATASYALARFDYKPKLGVIGMFIACLLLGALAVSQGANWRVIVPAAIVIFLVLMQTIGRKFKRHLGNNDIAFWLISQRMLPPVAVVVPIFIFFKTLNLHDTRTALIITYVAVNLPIVIWLMRDYFASIPLVLEESAAIDGATRLRTFISIILPISVPGLVATFLFVLVFTWNEYLLALFLSSNKAQTMPILVAAQNTTRGPQWWNMSVLILLMIGPVIAMAIALERFIARGILVGAVKG